MQFFSKKMLHITPGSPGSFQGSFLGSQHCSFSHCHSIASHHIILHPHDCSALPLVLGIFFFLTPFETRV